MFVQDRSAMIHLFNHFLQIKLRLCRAMLIAAAISCLSSPVAMAQNYPVSGVWVATDDRTPGSKGGACFTLKMLGIESILDESLPTVLIFSDGERIEVRAGFHSQQSIRSVRSAEDGNFRITELPSKRSSWLPWSKRQSYVLRIVDPVTIELGDGKSNTRFAKCSSKNSSL